MDKRGLKIKSFKEDNKYYFIMYIPNCDEYLNRFSGFGDSENSYEDALNKMIRDLNSNISERKSLMINRLRSSIDEASIELDEGTEMKESEVLSIVTGKINFYV
jgi:hypothetical protein